MGVGGDVSPTSLSPALVGPDATSVKLIRMNRGFTKCITAGIDLSGPFFSFALDIHITEEVLWSCFGCFLFPYKTRYLVLFAVNSFP
jgi:hypothetical protein